MTHNHCIAHIKALTSLWKRDLHTGRLATLVGERPLMTGSPIEGQGSDCLNVARARCPITERIYFLNKCWCQLRTG